MAATSTISNMYTDLVTALSGVIGKSAIYCGGRPDLTDMEPKPRKFIVVDLPVTISDLAAGNHKFHLVSTGVFYLFDSAKKDTTLNVNSMGVMIESVVDLFPIAGLHFSAVNPRVLMHGADENQYQVVTVTFDIHSK